MHFYQEMLFMLEEIMQQRCRVVAFPLPDVEEAKSYVVDPHPSVIGTK